MGLYLLRMSSATSSLSPLAAASVLASQEQAQAAAVKASATAKLVYFFRHGQSTANVGHTAAMDRDKADGCTEEELSTGKTKHLTAHRADQSKYRDAFLSPAGVLQCQEAASRVLEWSLVPSLVVVSPM